MHASEVHTLTARWVLPVDQPPLENGTVSWQGDRIVAIEPAGRTSATLDAGNCAIIPGLVNTHTHLDLTGLREQAPPSEDFTAWLRQVIAFRRTRSAEQVKADIREGIAESSRYGVTLIGDIASQGMSWNALQDAPLRSVVFYEVLGLPKRRIIPVLLELMRWRRFHRDTSTCRRAISPHAPYSVHRQLLRALSLLASKANDCCAVHLAETPAEKQLLETRSGPFVDFLAAMGVYEPDGLAADWQAVLDSVNHGGPRLFIHGNYLQPEAVLPAQSTIVYCPRTHAAFGHSSHPFRAFRDHGIRIALGTDSLASNPDLDLLAEARFLYRQHPDLSAELLRMATLSGAEALNWSDEAGSLTPGKSADLVLVPLRRSVGSRDPYDLLWTSPDPAMGVLYRGQWIRPPLFA